MRKIIVMIAAVLTFALVATATDFPTSELFLGYDFTRFYPNSGYVPDLNANGGDAQFTYNFSKWVGATVDVGSVTKGTLNHNNWDTTATSFTIGPRFAYHNHSRFTPYVEVLFGGAESSVSTEAGTFVAPPPSHLPTNATSSCRLLLSLRPASLLPKPGLPCWQAADSTSNSSVCPSGQSASTIT